MPDDAFQEAGLDVPPIGASRLSRAMRLAEVVAARLCHDLSGVAGTITNALELAREDRESVAEALSLAQDSATELGLRLRLMRATWSPNGGPLTMPELLRLADGLRSAQRLKIDASAVPPDLPFGAGAARLVLGAILLAEEGLPRGGRIALAGHPEREVVVMIEGHAASWPAGLAGWITDEEAAWQAIAQPAPRVGPLVALLAREQGARLSFLLAVGPSAPPPPLLVGFNG